MEKAFAFPQKSIVTKILEFGRRKKRFVSSISVKVSTLGKRRNPPPPHTHIHKDGRLFKGEIVLVTVLLSENKLIKSNFGEIKGVFWLTVQRETSPFM